MWDPLCVPCAEWMCEFGHELDPVAGNCLLEEGEGGEETLSMDFFLEGAEGLENVQGSYSFEFVFDFWSSPPDLSRCSDLSCCAGESICECQVMQHNHTLISVVICLVVEIGCHIGAIMVGTTIRASYSFNIFGVTRRHPASPRPMT